MYGLCSEAIWNGRTRKRNHELETQKHKTRLFQQLPEETSTQVSEIMEPYGHMGP